MQRCTRQLVPFCEDQAFYEPLPFAVKSCVGHRGYMLSGAHTWRQVAPSRQRLVEQLQPT